jgi:hypothetical protein
LGWPRNPRKTRKNKIQKISSEKQSDGADESVLSAHQAAVERVVAFKAFFRC